MYVIRNTMYAKPGRGEAMSGYTELVSGGKREIFTVA
jgi:hypothetical protein